MECDAQVFTCSKKELHPKYLQLHRKKWRFPKSPVWLDGFSKNQKNVAASLVKCRLLLSMWTPLKSEYDSLKDGITQNVFPLWWPWCVRLPDQLDTVYPSLYKPILSTLHCFSFGGYSSRSTSPLYGIQRPKWPSLPKHDTLILIDQNRGHGEWKDVAWPALRRQARFIAFLLPRRQCYARGPDSLRAPHTDSLGPPLVQPPAGEAQGCQGGCMLWWRQSGVGPGLGWRRRFQRKHRRRC